MGCNEILEPDVTKAITDTVESLPVWSSGCNQKAIVLVGSYAMGLNDEYPDIDINVLVEEPLFSSLLEPVWEAVDRGVVLVLNPRARLYNEFPLTYIPGVDGHFQIISANVIRDRIAATDDVTMWIYGQGEAITDEGGIYAEIKKQSLNYPGNIMREKRQRILHSAKEYYYGIKKQLERDHMESIQIMAIQSIANLLKFFCLCDGHPFPNDKWLYDVGLRTRLGTIIKEHLALIMTDLRLEHVVREKPRNALMKPEHRNAGFEEFRIYHNFEWMFEEINTFLLSEYPAEAERRYE